MEVEVGVGVIGTVVAVGPLREMHGSDKFYHPVVRKAAATTTVPTTTIACPLRHRSFVLTSCSVVRAAAAVTLEDRLLLLGKRTSLVAPIRYSVEP